jgi:hypothetical protein
MDEAKQKNISSYFSNSKRNSRDALDFKAENHNGIKNSIQVKRDKKNQIIKIGDSDYYTINRFFNFEKDEKSIQELNSNFINLEIKTEKGKNTVSVDNNVISPFLNNKFNDQQSDKNILTSHINPINQDPKIELFFKKVSNSISNTKLCVDDKVFSLDHFETKKIEKPAINILPNQNKFSTYIENNGNYLKNRKYEDCKITNWIKLTTYSDLNGINESVFQNILNYLNPRELAKTCLVNKTFLNFTKNTISSYCYTPNINTSKTNFTLKDFCEILKKGKNLKHIQLLCKIINSDFGGGKNGPMNFFSTVILNMSLSHVEDLKYAGTLLEAFKIRNKQDHLKNFFSSDSLNIICEKSKFTLRDLVLRGCFKLTNKISNGIVLCTFLEKLEISNNHSIDDEAFKIISSSCINIKSLNLSKLNKITGESIKSIGSHLKFLEELDLSESCSISGDSLIHLQNCPKLIKLFLDGIYLKDCNLVFTDYLREIRSFSVRGNTSLYFRCEIVD